MAAERALRVSAEVANPPGVTMQQQHTDGVETLGDDSEPPESELAATVVVQAEQQQEPSPPVTRDERCALSTAVG